MIIQGQVLDKDNLNRAFVSKTATGTQILLGSLNLSGGITATTLAGTHSGDGAGLTNLTATNLAGTINDARLSSNVMLLGTSQTITTNKTFSAAANLYFAGGTTYCINTVGDGKFNALTVDGIATFDGADYIKFTSSGYAPPSASSAGTKIILYDDPNRSYAFGVDADTVWYDGHTNHRFYTNGGTTTKTLRMTIDNTGVTIANNLSGTGTLTVSGTSTLTGNVTTSNDLTVIKNFEVQGEMKHNQYNEFPDPLLVSGETTNWIPRRTAVAFDPAQVPTGIGAYGSIKLTPSAADGYVIYEYLFDTSPNEWVTFSAYLYSTVVSRASQLWILWFKADKTPSTTIGVSLDIANTPTLWTRYNISGQAPADARYFKVRVDNDGYNASTNADMYFTGFQVERGHAMTGFKPYFGGNESGDMKYSGINIVGTKVVNDQGLLTLSNEDGVYGVISSKGNAGIKLKYNTKEIVIGEATGTAYTLGKVAIGASSTSQMLSVTGTSGSESGLGIFQITDGTAPLRMGSNSTYSWIQSHGSKPLYINTFSNNVILQANASANVGIGTTSPSERLDVSGKIKVQGNAENQLIIDMSSSDDGQINFVKTGDNTKVAGRIMFDGYASAANVKSNLRFYTANSTDSGATNGLSEKMTILSSGLVGIGITTPRYLLNLSGPDNKDTGPIIFLGGNASDQVEGGRIRFGEYNTKASYQGAHIHYNASTNMLHIGIHNADDVLTANDINAISIARADGAVTISTPTTLSGTLSITGNTTVGGTLGVTGAATFSNSVTASFFTGRIDLVDTRSVVTKPTTYARGMTLNFKTASVVSLPVPASTTYAGVMGFAQWSDNSGGGTHELAFNGDLGLYYRYGAKDATDAFGAWQKIMTSTNGGHGTGFNADKLDNQHASDLMSSTAYREKYVVGAGGLVALTDITIPNSRTYVLGTNRLLVFRDGILQDLVDDYNEVSATSIEFVYDLPAGSKVTFVILSAGA